MVTRWLAFGVWAVAAASAVAWGLRLFVPSPPVPAHASVALPSAAVGDLSRLFGVEPVAAPEEDLPEPVADARFQLIGVVTPRPAGAAAEGLALISVDGKPPRAYRVGATVDGEQVLQAVQARGATLGPRGGAALVALSIPPPPAANTGTLPSVGAAGAGSRNVGMPSPPGAPPNRILQGLPNQRYMPPGLRGNRPQAAPAAEEDADPNGSESVIDGGDTIDNSNHNANELKAR
jgi:general secretion pathway protein C